MKTQTIQLGEVCEFVYGEALKEDNRRNGKVPVYGSNGVVGWHDTALTQGATIVIGRKGSIGEVNWSNGPCFPIDTTYYVEKTERPCDLRWLYYTLMKLDLTRLNKSAAVPGLNRDDAYEQHILFPDVPEQERIAGQLEQADRLRRSRRYALELTDTFLPAAFLELFGNVRTNSKQWDGVTLGEIVVRGPQNGLYKPASAYGTGTPILRIDAFYDGEVTDIDSLKRVRLLPDDIECFGLDENDIVVNRVNSRPYLGKSALIPKLNEPTVFESNMMRLTLNTKSATPVYLTHYLQTSFVKSQIQVLAKDAVNQSSINQEDVKGLIVRLPPLPLQQKFAAVVERVERLRAVQREALRQAEHLFASLLHRAFSGEL